MDHFISKQRKKRRHYKSNIIKYLVSLLIALVLMIVSFSCEIIFNDKIPYYKEYAIGIYGAIFTIAALSGTVLSVLASMFDTRIYGVSLRKITKFKTYIYKPIYLIIMSMIIVAISTFMMIFGRGISIIFMLLFLIYIVCKFFRNAWKVIIDEEYCRGILLNEIECNKHNSEFWESISIDIFVSCKETIKRLNNIAVNKNLELLSKIYEIRINKENLKQLYNEQIKFVTLELLNIDNIVKVGFDRAITLYKLIDTDSFILKSDILSDSSKQYSLLSDEKLMQISLDRLINEVLQNGDINSEEKERYIEQIFAEVFSNNIIANENKIELLSQVIKSIYFFVLRDKEDNKALNEIKVKIWTKVYSKYVLTNSFWDWSLKIHDLMITTMLQDNYLFNEELIVVLLSNMFLLQYSYGFLEKEMISDAQRKRIKSLMKRKIIYEVENVQASVSFLLRNNMTKILNEIKKIMEERKQFRDFEFWGKLNHSKEIVWWDGIERILYLLYFNNFIYYDRHDLIYRTSNWDQLDDERKGVILSNFMDMFDFGTSRIKPIWLDRINEIGVWIGNKINVCDDMFSILFEAANEEKRLINLSKRKIDIGSVAPNMYVNPSILFSEDIENLEFVYTQNINCGFNDITIFKDESLIESAFGCCHYFLDMLIEREFKPIELSFDSIGIKTLLELVDTQNIKYGNYVFTNDLIFSREDRESNEFKLLEKKLSELTCCYDENIHKHIYFGEKIPQYNIRVAKPDRKHLTREEIEEVCSKRKLAEDRYNVQGDCVCNKQQAIDYVEKHYRKDSIKIMIKHNFKEIGAFYIEINHNNNRKKEI